MIFGNLPRHPRRIWTLTYKKYTMGRERCQIDVCRALEQTLLFV